MTANNVFFYRRNDKTYRPSDKEVEEAEHDTSDAGSDIEIVKVDLGSENEGDNGNVVLKQEIDAKMGKILNK